MSTYIAEGEAALLPLHNITSKALAFVWYRGEGTIKSRLIAFFITLAKYHIEGPEHRGRERVNADGSLLIKNVTMKDAGIYTVVVYVTKQRKEIGFWQLNVYGE